MESPSPSSLPMSPYECALVVFLLSLLCLLCYIFLAGQQQQQLQKGHESRELLALCFSELCSDVYCLKIYICHFDSLV